MPTLTFPRLSIIIPVYNVEPYLSRCLDSLLRQSLKELEIICVDDGSTDGCPAILADYAGRDERVKVITQINSGVSVARNTGMSQASAPYITFVDADDWMDDFYAKAIKVMQADSVIDFVNWGFQVIAEQSGGALEPVLEGGMADRYERYSGKNKLNEEIIFHTSGNCWNKIFKRELIEKNKPSFPPGLGIAEDLAFWRQYAAGAEYGYYFTERPYNYFIRHEGSATSLMQSKKLPNPLIYLDVFQYVHDYYDRQGKVESTQNRLLLGRLFIFFFEEGLRYTSDADHYIFSAAELAKKLNLPPEAGQLLRDLLSGRKIKYSGKIDRPKYTLAEKIFSVKNWREFKVICLLGFKIKLSRKPKQESF